MIQREENMNLPVMIVVVAIVAIVVVIQMMSPLMIGTNTVRKKVTEEKEESEVEVTNIVKENRKEKKPRMIQKNHTLLMTLERLDVKRVLKESKNERKFFK